MKLNRSHATLALLLFCAGLLIANLFSSHWNARACSLHNACRAAIPNAVQLSNSFSNCQATEPSVVQIVSTIQEKRTPVRGMFRGNPFGGQNPFGGDNPLEQMPQTPRRAMGLGSGFVVDRSGYIMTNNHVVEDATRIQVKLPGDSTEYPAKLIGTDPELDLAVLKIDAGKQLTPLKTGNSDAIESRRLGRGHWLAVRSRTDYDRRHHQREGARSRRSRPSNAALPAD